MPFLEYHSRLRQFVPSLAPEQAEDFVNSAWRDIRQANDEWSWLFATEYWIAPNQVTLPGLGVTQFSPVVVLNIGALALIAGLNNPAITQRQLRFGLTGGPVYGIASTNAVQVTDGAITSATDDLVCATSAPFSTGDVGKLIRVAGAGPSGTDLDTVILAFVSPTQVQLAVNASTTVGPAATVSFGSTITLDRFYAESTNSNITALLYRIYYSPTTQDFMRLDHLVDQIVGYPFGRVVRPIEVLDGWDPRRSSVTQPYYVFFREYDVTTGLPVYELWPGPTSARAYTVAFWRSGTDFINDTDSLPPRLSEELLLMRARMLAYEWGMVNDPDPRRRQSYQTGLQYARNRYSTEGQPQRPLGLLEQAKRQDKSVYAKMFNQKGGKGWGDYGWPPADSRFYQNHGLPALG
jgi:hypothetical protein